MVAIYSVASKARDMRFGIGFWGFVFPLGVFSAAATRLWVQLPELAAMRVVAAVLMCVCLGGGGCARVPGGRRLRLAAGEGVARAAGPQQTACGCAAQPTPAPPLRPARLRSCCTILLWCLCMAFTVVRGWNGSLFHAPCLQNRCGMLGLLSGRARRLPCCLRSHASAAPAGPSDKKPAAHQPACLLPILLLPAGPPSAGCRPSWAPLWPMRWWGQRATAAATPRAAAAAAGWSTRQRRRQSQRGHSWRAKEAALGQWSRTGGPAAAAAPWIPSVSPIPAPFAIAV